MAEKIMSDHQAMQMAIEEAKKGWGFVSPNPAVGCVILDKEGRILSKGYHKKYGGPHAEVEALQNLSDLQLKGAKVFVTLEPCAHFGKTPPCADLLATKPISTVVYGLQDPNPMVAGKGIQKLIDAGKQVYTLPDLHEELEEVAEHFLYNFRNQKAFFSLKMASSLDGHLALKNGDSKWITGDEARLYTHRLRAMHDAVLVGRVTVEHDNPQLNVRHPDYPEHVNQVIILDSQLHLLEKYRDLQIFSHHKPENIYIVAVERAIDEQGATVDSKIDFLYHHKLSGVKIIKADYRAGTGFQLSDLAEKLFQLQIHSVLVEGGAHTHSLFIQQKQFQRMFLFQAPLLIGGASGLSWSKNYKISQLSSALRFQKPNITVLGRDTLFSLKPKMEEEA